MSARAQATAERAPVVARPNSSPEREADRVAAEVADGASVADWSFGALPTAAPPLAQTPRGGAPLAPDARRDMEGRFGRDFGAVRLHDGGEGAQAARALQADAFTLGEHIATARPLSMERREDRHLLAHELSHVVQGEGTAPQALISRQATGGKDAPAEKPPAVSKPDREERLNVGRGKQARFDAFYNRREGFLMARVKVLFDFKESNPLPWPSQGAKDTWRSLFLKRVSDRWSFKHFLVPGEPAEGEPPRVAVAVNAVPVTSAPHYTMHVSYTRDRPTSFVQGSQATLDSQDVEQRPDIPQTPAEHEFGHMLGLEHIRCDRNDDECYGVSDEEKADVMGSGSYVSPTDYEVFAEQMTPFTGTWWRVEPASKIPDKASNATAIGAGVGAGLFGIAGAVIGGLLGGPLGAFIGGGIGLLAGAGLGALVGSTFE
jgi:Domain of unknown function (DUF4157)